MYFCTTACFFPKSLSPYAQALKHVALRGGKTALGKSAREAELALYRKGVLPADYRPFAHGKWDDTVERWAHAWQFPAVEVGFDDGEGEGLIRLVSQDRKQMQNLLEFGTQLLSSPPSESPQQSGDNTFSLSNQEEEGNPNGAEEARRQDMSSPDSNSLEAAVEGLSPPLLLLSCSSSSSEAATASPPPPMVVRNSSPVPLSVLESIVPRAYIDDGSTKAAASKQLCYILEESGLDYTEDGLTVAIAAMASSAMASLGPSTVQSMNNRDVNSVATRYFLAARAIFNWVGSLGLGPNSEMYKALMRHPSSRGDAQGAMELIEEMKERGVTPTIGNWHELMRAFIKAKDYETVHQIVDNMKMYANIEPNEVTFALQLRALAKGQSMNFNALAEAVQLFDQMEQVYGFIPSRPHYDAMMFALCQSPAPEMRLRCEELAKKMELMGMMWDRNTFLYLIRSAQVVGDVEAVELYLGKMRERGLPLTSLHLAWAIQAHVQRVTRLHQQSQEAQCVPESNDGEEGEGEGSSSSTLRLVRLAEKLSQHSETCFGIYHLIQQRGWEMQLPVLNALLRLSCQCSIILYNEYSNLGIHGGGEGNTNERAREMNGDGGTASSSSKQLQRYLDYFEDHTRYMWEQAFDEWHLTRDMYSYECYITLLAQQQRIDEAERLFQQMVLSRPLSSMDYNGNNNSNAASHHSYNEGSAIALAPTRRTYESLIFMHLSSGEEGGAARALFYLEALEKSGIPIRGSLLQKMVRVHNAAGYKRDMKRRARRIMQAREEYMQRKAEWEMGGGGGEFASPTSTGTSATSSGNYHPPTMGFTTPVPPREDDRLLRKEGGISTVVDTTGEGEEVKSLAKEGVSSSPSKPWNWEEWNRTTIHKHELFDEENPDGTPKGETFEEKNIALAKMGIENSPFREKSDVPSLSPHSLTAKIRASEGEIAGGLWALDGGELGYPKDGGGPEGWGVRLWRERQILKKEFENMKDGVRSSGGVPSFSSAGNAVRVAGDQVDIELSGAKTPGELSDWRKYPEHRYDDTNRAKPASEMAFSLSFSESSSAASALVWQHEARDPLAPYKTDEEIAVANDNVFYQQLEEEASAKTREVVSVLQERREQDVDITGRGPTRRSKYDYLEKWREMYRHGSLDVSDLSSPSSSSKLLHFGRTPEDHKETLSSVVREWHERQKRKQPAARLTSRNKVSSEASGFSASEGSSVVGEKNDHFNESLRREQEEDNEGEKEDHRLHRWSKEEEREKDARLARRGMLLGAKRRRWKNKKRKGTEP